MNAKQMVKVEIDGVKYVPEYLIKKQQEEIERMQNICDSYIVQYGTVAHKEVLLKKERADTVKKMREKLISAFCPDADYCGYDIHAAINAKAGEMLE